MESVRRQAPVAMGLHFLSDFLVLDRVREGAGNGGGYGALLRVELTCAHGDAVRDVVVHLTGDGFHGSCGRQTVVKVDVHRIFVFVVDLHLTFVLVFFVAQMVASAIRVLFSDGPIDPRYRGIKARRDAICLDVSHGFQKRERVCVDVNAFVVHEVGRGDRRIVPVRRRKRVEQCLDVLQVDEDSAGWFGIVNHG